MHRIFSQALRTARHSRADRGVHVFFPRGNMRARFHKSTFSNTALLSCAPVLVGVAAHRSKQISAGDRGKKTITNYQRLLGV